MSTVLVFCFLDYEEKYFNFLEINSQKFEIKDKILKIEIKKIINREHCIENIKLLKDENINAEHKIDIYINCENIFYCFLGSKNSFSFQILYYERKNLKESLDVKLQDKSYKLNKYDNFGLKYCRRFNIINCQKDSVDIEEFNIPNHLKDGSYYINIFNSKISLLKLKQPKYYELNFENISNKDYLINLDANINNEYNKMLMTGDSKETKNNTFFQILFKKLLPLDNYIPYKNLQFILAGRRELKLNEIEYKICYGYALLKLLFSLLKFSFCIYELYGIILNLINELKNKIPHSFDIIRILFWYSQTYLDNPTYFTKIVDLFKKDKLNIDEIHDFKFVYPKICKNGTPYKECYTFLNNFISDINEESYLLEIIYLLDSDTSNNRIYKNVRLFELSLLSIEQIKSHLHSIIPDVIIRKFHSDKDESNGSYIYLFGVMEIFEGTLYNLKQEELDFILVDNEDKECKYTLPLTMVFLHELIGHAKHRLDSYISLSPTHYYNPHDNYKLCYHCFLGESGRLFEFYISPNINIISYLKFSLSSNKELLSTKLWTANDLSKLRKIVLDKIANNNAKFEQKINYFPDGVEDKNLILANGDEGDKSYFSDESTNYYEKDGEVNRFYMISKNNFKISCI